MRGIKMQSALKICVLVHEMRFDSKARTKRSMRLYPTTASAYEWLSSSQLVWVELCSE